MLDDGIRKALAIEKDSSVPHCNIPLHKEIPMSCCSNITLPRGSDLHVHSNVAFDTPAIYPSGKDAKRKSLRSIQPTCRGLRH